MPTYHIYEYVFNVKLYHVTVHMPGLYLLCSRIQLLGLVGFANLCSQILGLLSPKSSTIRDVNCTPVDSQHSQINQISQISRLKLRNEDEERWKGWYGHSTLWNSGFKR